MKAFKLFKIKPEERIQSLVALTVIVLLNALFIYRMHDLFMQEGFGPYWKVFEHELHLSGYDPLTYLTVTDWDVIYQVYRHPLLAFMMWPLYLLNEGLTWLLGVNCVQYLVALPLIVCSFYSYIFLYRIHREVIALERSTSRYRCFCCSSHSTSRVSVFRRVGSSAGGSRPSSFISRQALRFPMA